MKIKPLSKENNTSRNSRMRRLIWEIDRSAASVLLLVDCRLRSSNSALTKNQSLSANKLTVKPTTMADRPSLVSLTLTAG